MQTIELRESMFDSVVYGEKTKTLRKGERDYKLGETVILGTERNRSMLCNITEISITRLSNITEADAKAEGYKSFQELYDVLEKIYGELEPTQVVTQATFEFIKEFRKSM